MNPGKSRAHHGWGEKREKTEVGHLRIQYRLFDRLSFFLYAHHTLCTRPACPSPFLTQIYTSSRCNKPSSSPSLRPSWSTSSSIGDPSRDSRERPLSIFSPAWSVRSMHLILSFRLLMSVAIPSRAFQSLPLVERTVMAREDLPLLHLILLRLPFRPSTGPGHSSICYSCRKQTRIRSRGSRAHCQGAMV